MEEKKQVTIPAISLAAALLMKVAIGVLVLVIGAATETNGAIYAGLIITPLALLSSGFLLKEENSSVRISMLEFGGLFLLSVLIWALTQL